MRNKTWSSCGSKNRYRDEHTANHYKKMYERERGVSLDYYWCTYCNGFHLTSTKVNYEYYSIDKDLLPTVV